MFHRTSLIIITLGLLLAACTSAATPAPTAADPSLTLASQEMGMAHVHSIEILMMESMPVQIRVHVNGELPDSCTKIDAITQSLDVVNNRIWVEIVTQRQAEAACIAGPAPFEEDVSLDVIGLLAGTYTVDINGITGMFVLAVDNVSQEPPPAGPAGAVAPVGAVALAPVERVTLQIAESFPVQVIALVGGNLPDGCTKIDQITQSREVTALRLNVQVTTVRATGVICTEALVPFEEMVPLDVVGLLAGTYTVDVNGRVVTFILEQDNLLNETPVPTPIGGEPGETSVEATPTDVPLPDDLEMLGMVRLGGMDLRVTGTIDLKAKVVAWGNLPDSCTQVGPVTQRRDVNARKLWVEIPLVRPKGAVCTAVITPFEETIELDLTGLPAGEYTIDVNGIPGAIVMGTDNPAP